MPEVTNNYLTGHPVAMEDKSCPWRAVEEPALDVSVQYHNKGHGI